MDSKSQVKLSLFSHNSASSLSSFMLFSFGIYILVLSLKYFSDYENAVVYLYLFVSIGVYALTDSSHYRCAASSYRCKSGPHVRNAENASLGVSLRFFEKFASQANGFLLLPLQKLRNWDTALWPISVCSKTNLSNYHCFLHNHNSKLNPLPVRFYI